MTIHHSILMHHHLYYYRRHQEKDNVVRNRIILIIIRHRHFCRHRREKLMFYVRGMVAVCLGFVQFVICHFLGIH